MNAVVITRKINEAESKQIAELLNNKSSLYLSPDVSSLFPKYKERTLIEQKESTKRKINKEIMDDIVQFGETIINGTSLTDYFSYEKLSLWHYYKFRTYFEVRNLMYELNFLTELQKKYNHIYYFGNNRVIKKYSSYENTTYYFSKTKKTGFNYYQLFKYLFFFIFRVFLGFLKNHNLTQKKHLIIDHTSKQTVLDINTLRPKKDNYVLSYLFDKISNDFSILDDVNFPEKKTTYNFKLQVSQFFGNNRIFGESIIFKGLISSKARNEAKSLSNSFKTKLKSIDTSMFTITQKIIFDIFESNAQSALLFILKYVSYKRFFNHNRFKTISSIDENSPRIKSILDAGKANGVKTIGIQHGAIHELHPAYMFTTKDMEREIPPDLTLLWGDYWKTVLINKGNYRNDSLRITGQLRSDIIPKILDNKLYYNNLKEVGKKLVLFATQPQPDKEQRRKDAENIFRSMKENNRLFLVLKLHPAEINDFDFYHSIAKSVNFFNYKILYWEDLYLLLNTVDVVITSFSTVGSEAVYFNKPLIIMDAMQQDIQNYYKENVAYCATNHLELAELLNKFSSGQLQINSTYYQRFITKYSYAIDGKAATRTINFITKII